MDTRSKILTPAQAAGLTFDTLVAGYFDPVVADHVERLSSLGKVTVSLLDPPDEILPLGARAELIAALDCVDRVVTGDVRAQAKTVIDFTAGDLATRDALIERIRQRSATPVV